MVSRSKAHVEYAKSLQSSKPSGSDAIPLCKQDVLGVPCNRGVTQRYTQDGRAGDTRSPSGSPKCRPTSPSTSQCAPTLRLNQDVRSSDIVNIDSMGFLWAARALGLDFPEVKVAGIDLMEALIGLCAREGYRPYLLGATGDVLEKTIANIRKRLIQA